MRGSIRRRGKKSWLITLEFGYIRHPETGIIARERKFITFHGTKREAQDKLSDLISDTKRGAFVEPSKVTLGEWLKDWLAVSVKPRCRPATYTRYKGIIEQSLLKADIARMPLQQLRPSHLEAYYAGAGVSASTLTLHHAILHRALRKAVRDRLVLVNVAADVEGKPRRNHNREAAREHAWTADEARAFLAAARAAGSQPAAFYALALDSGARKGEICGLRWSDLDLTAAKMRIVRQLLKPGPAPEFGPPKNGQPRTVSLAAETIALLRAHKRHQARLKMANRTTYAEQGLVFAKEWSEVRKRGDCLGQPLQINNLGQREYAQLIKASGVRRIKFHGLRHTCATLLLQAGEPVHVVAERLGHKRTDITLDVYAHVLPDMQQGAARRLNALLYGR
jgi:integrase